MGRSRTRTSVKITGSWTDARSASEIGVFPRQFGPTGGVELPLIRSYTKAWDAAVDGLAIWQRQQARDAKKASIAAPAAAKTAICTSGKIGNPRDAQGERAPFVRSCAGVVSPEDLCIPSGGFPMLVFSISPNRR